MEDLRTVEKTHRSTQPERAVGVEKNIPCAGSANPPHYNMAQASRFLKDGPLNQPVDW
jgi:hypothetical protein